MSNICPYCLAPYDDIYTVAYEQTSMDMAFAHFAPEELAAEVGLPREMLVSWCGIDAESMLEPGTKVLLKKDTKSIHILKNTKRKGNEK